MKKSNTKNSLDQRVARLEGTVSALIQRVRELEKQLADKGGPVAPYDVEDDRPPGF